MFVCVCVVTQRCVLLISNSRSLDMLMMVRTSVSHQVCHWLQAGSATAPGVRRGLRLFGCVHVFVPPFSIPFLHLADRFPPILDLTPAVGQPALAPSKQAEFASREFVRIVPDAPLVRD